MLTQNPYQSPQVRNDRMAVVIVRPQRAWKAIFWIGAALGFTGFGAAISIAVRFADSPSIENTIAFAIFLTAIISSGLGVGLVLVSTIVQIWVNRRSLPQ